MQHIAIFTRPDGGECFYAEGLGHWPEDRSKAQRFQSADIAARRARAVIYGEPAAFWNSERAHNERTRARHKGWQFRVEEIEAEGVR